MGFIKIPFKTDKMKIFNIIGLLVTCMVGLTSCGLFVTGKLSTKNVVYQSIRTQYAQPTESSPIPDDAKIAVVYTISEKGDISAIVYNRTSEIMTINQVKSFFVDTDGKSTSYYDPTIRTTSTTNMSSATKGASVNLGGIAGALGVGGFLGQVAGGINIGGSGTIGQSITNATYIADQPEVSLAPKSNGAMSKIFKISGVDFREYADLDRYICNLTDADNNCRFSICISYSIDGGKSYEKLVTDFHVSSRIIIPLKNHGAANDAVGEIYAKKNNALYEPWWMLGFNHTVDEKGYQIIDKKDSFTQGLLIDYQ